MAPSDPCSWFSRLGPSGCAGVGPRDQQIKALERVRPFQGQATEDTISWMAPSEGDERWE